MQAIALITRRQPNSMPTAQHFKHPIDTEQTAIDALAECTGLSKAELKTCFSKGAVWLTQGKQKPVRLRRVKKDLKPGDFIELYYNPDVLHEEATAPRLMLDKKQYSVWFKPRGILSQGSKWADHTALYRWVEMNYHAENESSPRQAWITHRLDRATAGLQILAHTKKMAQILTGLFEKHQIDKQYQAIVHGEFPQETQTYKTPIDDKPAVTHVQRLAYEPERNLTQVQVTIESGRKHQIRKHLSQAGFPIVGDRLYGDEPLDNSLNMEQRPDLQLTAFRLQFTCPVDGEPIDIELNEEQLDLLPINTTQTEPG
ncbi:RluA family pseudouridine synthase [Thiomicrorhabdus sp. ZW0627]|uniref:RluA family pseudouridine synthase n=1 Tax=Thiomicrorhabdus sp. ZW0627 TaxID=3039774 RepID=UPI00243651EE|nr:RluA family pseudouridine synthase [Thiomicrorhabdus sp. ZW0627]MDG6773990.1 RluA family pseudouridine synthase [Thiomicrorhabdus sp. ZW0627]